MFVRSSGFATFIVAVRRFDEVIMHMNWGLRWENLGEAYDILHGSACYRYWVKVSFFRVHLFEEFVVKYIGRRTITVKNADALIFPWLFFGYQKLFRSFRFHSNSLKYHENFGFFYCVPIGDKILSNKTRQIIGAWRIRVVCNKIF